MTVGVIRYGLGNVGSVLNMLLKIGVTAKSVGTPEELGTVDRLILPGVGAFDQGMQRLNASGLRPELERLVLEQRVPILGICLGMQVFGRGSEEGRESGLGWLPFSVRRFVNEGAREGLSVPHMGWNHIASRTAHPILQGFRTTPRFYFVHSYYVAEDRPDIVVAETQYGAPFTSAVAHANIVGVQFHPEKSHRFGMQIMANFAAVSL